MSDLHIASILVLQVQTNVEKVLRWSPVLNQVLWLSVWELEELRKTRSSIQPTDSSQTHTSSALLLDLGSWVPQIWVGLCFLSMRASLPSWDLFDREGGIVPPSGCCLVVETGVAMVGVHSLLLHHRLLRLLQRPPVYVGFVASACFPHLPFVKLWIDCTKLFSVVRFTCRQLVRIVFIFTSTNALSSIFWSSLVSPTG